MPDVTFAQRLGRLIGRMRESVSLLWRLEARLKGVEFQGRVVLVGRPIISVAKNSRLVLGDGVRINSAVRANDLGNAQPCVLRTLCPGAELILGQRVAISGTVLCAGLRIEIGEGTIIGSGAMVIDNDFHAPRGQWDWGDDYLGSARPVRIGRGVFVGARAVILKGVTIGDRAVIGAASVVTSDVPAGSVAAGNPARVLQGQNRFPTSEAAGASG